MSNFKNMNGNAIREGEGSVGARGVLNRGNIEICWNLIEEAQLLIGKAFCKV